MESGAISDELRTFTHAFIDSVEQLEVLKLVAEDPARAWTPKDVADRLYIQASSAEKRLQSLVESGLCKASDPPASFRYAPSTPDKQRLVSDLLSAYAVRHVAVITLIFSRPAPINSFSDAFRLRRDE